MGKSKDGNVTCFMYTQMRIVGLGRRSCLPSRMPHATRTRTAASSEEPSPIHFDHSHPWNANDRRGQGLVLELVGFQVTFLRHLLADLLSDSTHLTATDCDLRQLAKHLGRQTKRAMRTTSDHDLPEDRCAEAMPVKSQRGTEREKNPDDMSGSGTSARRTAPWLLVR